jgi:hypothetical protein
LNFAKLKAMNRTSESPVLAHARQSLARAQASAAAVRTRLRAGELRDLDAGLAGLVESFAGLEAATDTQLPRRWSQFFACYDRVLALLRTFENPVGKSD